MKKIGVILIFSMLFLFTACSITSFFGRDGEKYYTVTVKLYEGEEVVENEELSYLENSTFYLDDYFTYKEGYEFDGFYDEAGNYIDEDIIVTGDFTLVGYYTLIEYSITYILPSIENNPSNPNHYSVKDKDGIKIYDPIYPNYYVSYYEITFNNSNDVDVETSWHHDETGQDFIIIDYEYLKYWSADLTIRPIYELNEYRIDYDCNGGENHWYNLSNLDSFNINSSNDSFEKPKKAGYNFVGWYLDNEFKTEVKSIKDLPLENVTLYAKWELRNYDIKYTDTVYKEINEIIDALIENKTLKTTYNVEENTVTLLDINSYINSVGYTFEGYYTDANFRNKITELKTEKISNQILYLNIIPCHVISYNNTPGRNIDLNDIETSLNLEYCIPTGFTSNITLYDHQGKAVSQGNTYDDGVYFQIDVYDLSNKLVYSYKSDLIYEAKIL